MPEFTFLIHDQTKKNRRADVAIMNRQTALHKHSQRRKALNPIVYEGPVQITQKGERRRGEDKPPRKHLQRRWSSDSTESRLSRAPPPIVGNGDFVLDLAASRILHYYVQHWMPSTTTVVDGAQLTGFTPVHAEDLTLGKRLLHEAFHSKSNLSLYAILTVCSRRMKVVNEFNSGIDLPEAYAVKAIAALRDVVETKSYFSSRLILDISYLVLSEVYTQSPQKSSTYDAMIRDIIIMYGGLHKVDPFTAQACLGWDFLMSAFSLSPPALDPYRHPELLILAEESAHYNEYDLHVEVHQRAQQLPDRPRVFTLESHAFTDVVEVIHKLPESAQQAIHTLIGDCRGTITNFLLTPLSNQGDSVGEQSSVQRSAAAAADNIYIHVKIRMYLIWAFETAITFLKPGDEVAIERPPESMDDLSILLGQVSQIRQLLRSTSWSVKSEILLWIASLAFVCSETPVERGLSLSLMDEVASSGGVTDQDYMRKGLGPYPPLSLLQARRTTDSDLWSSHLQYRQQYG